MHTESPKKNLQKKEDMGNWLFGSGDAKTGDAKTGNAKTTADYKNHNYFILLYEKVGFNSQKFYKVLNNFIFEVNNPNKSKTLTAENKKHIEDLKKNIIEYKKYKEFANHWKAILQNNVRVPYLSYEFKKTHYDLLDEMKTFFLKKNNSHNSNMKL